MIRIIALILALAAFSGIYAQEIITGTVVDAEGAPVQSVTVKLVKGRLTRSFARTKSDGSYSLNVPRRSDSLSVTFEHLSYDKVTMPLPVGNVLDVVMTPRSRELREVVVAAPSVKLRGDTLSFFLDMFKGKGDVVLEDALKKIPGITVEDNGVIKYMGKDISNFYVEGLDMLGGRYSIATRSIPADYVKDVQVISNHHDLKIDKDKVSDNVAVNIKLKSKALFKPMGTVEAGAGYGDKRLRYALSGTGMLFKGSLQSLVTLKGGNMERFADNTNAVRVVGTVGNTASTAASSVVSAPEGARPPINQNRYENARDRLLSANTIVKTGKDATLRANASYTYSHHDFASSSTASYFTGGGTPLVVEEYTAPGSSVHTPSLDLEYKINSDSLYFSNALRATGEISAQAVPGLSDGIPVAQRRKVRTFRVADALNYQRKLGDRRWAFSTNVSFAASPVVRLNIAGRSGEADFTANQMAKSNTVSASQGATTSWQWARSELYLPVEIGYAYTDLSTTLVRADGLYGNRLYSNTTTAGLSPRYEYTSADKMLNISVTVPLSLKYLAGRNAATGEDKSTVRLLARPNVYSIIRPSGTSEFVINGSFGTTVGDLLGLLTQPVQKSYRTLETGSGLISRGRGWDARVTYRYKRPLDFFLTNFSINYSSNRNNLLGSQYVLANETFLTSIASDNTTDIFGASAKVTKTFMPIGTDVSLGAAYTWSRRQIMQQDIYVRYYSRSFTISPALTTRPWRWMELKWNGTIYKNFNRYLSSHSSYFDFTENATLSVFPGGGLELRLKGEHYRREIADNNFKNIVLMDFGVTWRHGKWRWNLALNNLLNKRSYAYTVFNGLDTWRYDYRLNGRTALLGVAFTL